MVGLFLITSVWEETKLQDSEWERVQKDLHFTAELFKNVS